jgi:chaperonin GroES
MAVNFVPLHDRILVRRVQEEETTQSGLIIPDSAKEKPQEGEVLSVGKGKITEDGKVLPLDLKPGNRILFGKYSGTDIVLEGEEYLIMREDEVLGILAKSTNRAKEAA